MPKLLIYNNIVFIVFSVDINETRKHVHVIKKSVNGFYPAKIWLEPEIEISNQGSFTEKEINNIKKIVFEQKDILINQLNLFFEGKKIKVIRK
jgi:hypothetical protein